MAIESARGLLEPPHTVNKQEVVHITPSKALNMNSTEFNSRSQFSNPQVLDRSSISEYTAGEQSIRRRFIDALSTSIVGIVCKSGHWLPIGSNGFTGPCMSLSGQKEAGSPASDDGGISDKVRDSLFLPTYINSLLSAWCQGLRDFSGYSLERNRDSHHLQCGVSFAESAHTARSH